MPVGNGTGSTASGGGGGVTTAASTTATNTAITVPGHDLFQGLWPTGSDIVTFSTAAVGANAVSLGSHGAGYIVPEVVFPSAAGGNVTLVGFDRAGAAQSVTIINPGGGTVVSTKAFSTITSAANTAPSGSGTVTVQASQWLAMSHAPITAFLRLTGSGTDQTADVDATDLTNGMVRVGLGAGGVDNTTAYDITYTYSLNLVQASHTHVLS